ncbi:MAG: gamma-glutamylcyclotransferase [Rhizobacter sp.]
MNSDSNPLRPEDTSTRERLRDGTLLDGWRANPPPGVRLRSEAELEVSLAEVLRSHEATADVHVFGCGSLMWNPALEYAQALRARVHGWHRRFCMRVLLARGSPQEPGAMLALDRGGACHGMLYRIAADKVASELHLLWRREMAAGSYDARWVPVVAEGRTLRALAFVANRRHDRYIGHLPPEQVAQLICTGKGSLGTCRSYFDATLQALETLGIKDAGMERLRRAVLRLDRR